MNQPQKVKCTPFTGDSEGGAFHFGLTFWGHITMQPFFVYGLTYLNTLFIIFITINIISITVKIPVIPVTAIGNVCKNTSKFIFIANHLSECLIIYYPIKAIINPPAITDAI